MRARGRAGGGKWLARLYLDLGGREGSPPRPAVARGGRMANRVVVIGGGLAGLAATAALAVRCFDVAVLEARGRLGGRAGSFTDAATGQLVDACQHVSMGCCTNFAHFCRTVGIDTLLQTLPRLAFMTPDRRVSPLAADPLPAPLHLARSFLRAHYLTLAEKARIAWGLARLKNAMPQAADVPFGDWLRQHRQTPRTAALAHRPVRGTLLRPQGQLSLGLVRHNFSVRMITAAPGARACGG